MRLDLDETVCPKPSRWHLASLNKSPQLKNDNFNKILFNILKVDFLRSHTFLCTVVL